ncbi:hypothetical protein B0J11DRAFT_171713 [Dendryphion nanum]|uniref:Uncharacterized protein n=1 Tax=Dendryphion nanum TaxID=256645 RepID=A0A9P9EET0_9PLEO|nr:hypothetical protein B0J11DRAFT_171713 [Dendryphion nanum]
MAALPQDSDLQLAEQLSKGFAALSSEYQLLFDQQKQLESKLSWSKQQYLDLLKRFSPDTLAQDHRIFLQDLERVASEVARTQPDRLEQVNESEESESKDRISLIQQAELAVASLRHRSDDQGVAIWTGPSADKKQPSLRIQPDLVAMEKDFTTTGTPSKLGCPFASPVTRHSPLATPRSSTSRMSFRGRRSKRPSFTDPIRAEICANDQVSASASASVEGSAAVCPIRFLNQHEPEEMAKYFENHKHEIPRSHEVCIQRFQSNTESIEQLDRKYGNLVSMIQGLGQKHQEFLPPEPEEDGEEPGNEPRAEQNVEKWANAVTASLHNLTPDEESPDNALDEARTAHFDRPMKEIRVGESPSRPWGISIPAKYTDAESSSSVGSAPTASPALPVQEHAVDQTPEKPSKCPFDHRAMANAAEMKIKIDSDKPNLAPRAESIRQPIVEPRASPVTEAARNAEYNKPAAEPTPITIPQMVFNGPVFLGYPPDQLITLLQNSNLGGMMR